MKRKNSSLIVEIKEEFIELALALEPERLYQDGERSKEDVEIVFKELNDSWNMIERKYQVTVTPEEALSWIHKEI